MLILTIRISSKTQYLKYINLTEFDINSVSIYWSSAGGKGADNSTKISNFFRKLSPETCDKLCNGTHRTMYWKKDKKLVFGSPWGLSTLDAIGINKMYPATDLLLP